MKRLFLSFFLTTLFFLLHSSFSLAQATEGNTTSHIEVHNDISGNGSVSTHVESTVNGKTQTYDSDKPGDVIIDNNGKTVTITTPTPSVSPPLTPIGKQESKQGTFIGKIKSLLESLFHSLFSPTPHT